MNRIIGLLSIGILSLALASCNGNLDCNQDDIDESFSYYRTFEANKEKKLYVFADDKDTDFKSLFQGQAIQGLFARTGSMFYCAMKEENDMWLDDLVTNYGFIAKDIRVSDMIRMYKEKFKEKAGYVLYDEDNHESINSATTMCGVLDAIPATSADEEFLNSLGIKKLGDATNMKERECFSLYKDKLNNDGSLQLRGDIPSGRDYSIACRYLTFYPEGLDKDTIKFRGQVHNWLKQDSPIFGWGPHTEDQHVGVSSEHGQFTIPSDHGYNQSLYSSGIGKQDIFKQPNSKLGIKAQKDKHYVCITRSDGDNLQTWYNYFPVRVEDMKAPRGNFPMGWTIQPSLADLAPNVMNYVYRNADKNDHFVCGVSGQGYIYPLVFPVLDKFLGHLDSYLKKTDLNIVQILDSGFNDDVIEAYSKVKGLKGGMYLFGNKYEEGHGSIRWSKNGKPFISCRKSLWSTDPEAVAREINSYKRDPSSIEGYTFVNLHPWSMNYQDVCKMVDNLDSDVVVVSPEDFIDLIIENVEKKDVEF